MKFKSQKIQQLWFGHHLWLPLIFGLDDKVGGGGCRRSLYCARACCRLAATGWALVTVADTRWGYSSITWD